MIEDTTMCATPAQIEANRRNAARSSGPKSESGKAQSRANSYKHGLTGDGVVLDDADAAEVARLTEAYRKETGATGEAGDALVRRMAVLKVRMDRCVEHEEATTRRNVREALDEFVPPEGATPEQVAKLRAEVKAIAQFDTSKEACLVRKYEAAAERGYFRAMKEIDRLKKDKGRAAGDAAEAEMVRIQKAVEKLGSFLPPEIPAPAGPAPAPPRPASNPSKPLPVPSSKLPADWDPFPSTHFDLPIAIGKPR